jgi:hypothetical protein
MATTTNYSWSTPDDTALVKDGAAAIRTLGSSADTTVKALNPGTTAGDVDYYTAATTKARIAIGTAGQVLTVNSGATAPQWATLPASAPASATASVVTQQNTTSTSFTDLTTAGPAVTLTTGTKVLVIVTCWLTNGTSQGDAESDFAVSGATTRAANEETSLYFKGDAANTSCGLRASSATYLTVTAGSNTFTVKYRRQAGVGTATFKNRQITVIDLGS